MIYRSFGPSSSSTGYKVAKVAGWIFSLGILPLIAIGIVWMASRYFKLVPNQEARVAQIRQMILATPPSFRAYDTTLARKKDPFNSIVGGLCLGNSDAFLSASHLRIEKQDAFGRPAGLMATDNPAGFRQIVTVCSLLSFSEAFLTDASAAEDAISEAEASIRHSAERIGLVWHYFGKAIQDGKAREEKAVLEVKWGGLVHDCTESSPLADQEIMGMTDEALLTLTQNKRRVMSEKPAREWFEKSFQVLDRAVFGNEKTLVHCQAGVSRSASLIIAYLINRFDVTALEAIAFVRSRRPCVDPGFLVCLEDYHAALLSSPA